MNIIARKGRTLLMTAAVVGALCLSGCGGDSGTGSSESGGTTPGTTPGTDPGTTPGGGNNTIVSNTCTSGGTCKSKRMPDGKTWMTENLNIETADSWCYNNSSDSCAKYGRLYTWPAANTACPTGWHLPSRAEWGALAKAAGGTGDYGSTSFAGWKLKSTSGWKDNRFGKDDYGFSALPGGSRYSDGSFLYAAYHGCWWTATENISDYIYNRCMAYNNDDVAEGSNLKDVAFSVRCIAN
ncbi:hypothetical protein R80B4_02380 [Fibrobacteres bacterium R8-0-B4]